MKTINKLFTVVALAMVLVGAAFALPVREVEKQDSGASVKWSKEVERIGKMSLKNVKGADVSEINQANFLLGHYFMRTVYDAIFAEMDGTDYEAVIEDLDVLMQAFAGTPEQAKLEGLLKQIEAGTADVEQVIEVITELEKSYRAGLSEEEDWFLLYGEWTTSLIGDTHLEDDEYIYEDLAALQELAEAAPDSVSKQIIEPVGSLSRFAELEGFVAEDYKEMQSVAFNIFDLVFGE